MVKEYNCEKCGKLFKQKSHYTTHLNKKTSCINENKIKENIERIVIEKVNELLNNIKISEENIELEQILEFEPEEILAAEEIISIEPEEILAAEEIISTESEVILNEVSETIIAVVPEEINNIKLNVLDLFCGVGGMSKGLVDSGLNVIAGIDIWDKAINNYKKNYEHKAICFDLTKLPPEIFSKNYDVNTIDIIVGGPPCFIEGTKVLTNTGYKNIEDVLLEDKLLTHTGNFQNILNLQKKIYTGNLYELGIKYHPEIITCTEEHPFYVREKKTIWDNSIRRSKIFFDEPKWKNAKDLTLNDYYGMVINSNNIIPEFTFDKIINQHKTEKININLDKPEHWFMMGYFIGDGWIEETKKRENSVRYNIRFAINNNDEKEVFEKINKVLSIVDQRCDTGKYKKFGCSNFLWFKILKMFGKYAHGKLIPEWIHDAPIEFIQEFVGGYMKADGNIRKNGSFQLTTVSHDLAYGLQRLYLKLGYIFSVNKTIRPKTYIIEGITVNQRDIYCVRGYLKKCKFTSFIENNYAWLAPFKIIKKETINTPVYNFEVENDNSYIVMNTIVHNCQSFSMAGRRDLNDPRNSLLWNL